MKIVLVPVVLAFLFAAAAASAAAEAELSINEIMASNRDTIADEDGDFEDWIEIYNSGGQDVDLTGFYLSDDSDNVTRWQFPEGLVESEGYLVVWASGKDRVGPGGALHTNFRLDRDGEPVYLVAPDGETVIDSLEAVPVPRGMSYGRLPDGSSNLVHFDQADVTPGKSNDGSSAHFLPQAGLEVHLSHKRGFYGSPFSLEITSSDPEAVIYYTLDGSEPHPDNVGGRSFDAAYAYPGARLETRTYETFVYTEPIFVEAGSGLPNDIVDIRTARNWNQPRSTVFKGVTVRAAAYIDEETFSETATHTFFVDENMDERYTLPVISLAANPADLFSYERGIYVPGKVYDQLHDSSLAYWQQPGNYSQRGREWERPGFMEYFEPEGTVGLAQNIGLRIHGGATRTRDRKSLRLYARSEYDEQNRFDYEFFPGLKKYNRSGELVEDYNRLILRNSGNDSNATLLRDAIMQELVDPIGMTKQAFSPAVVFINGEYWGLMNIRERLDPHYVESHFDVDKDDVAILYDYHNNDGTAIGDGSKKDLQDFVGLRGFIDQQDMSITENYEHVQTQMDIENFIDYYMANIYFRNTDWPHNNNRFWRKRVDEHDPNAAPYHDGRWRWIMFDTDFGFDDPSHDTMRWAMDEKNERTGQRWPNMMLRGLLDNESFRHAFVNRLADAMNTIFHPHRVHQVIDAMYRLIEPELSEHRERWGHGGQYPQFMKDFASERRQFLERHVVRALDLPGVSTVTLSADPSKGHIRINSVDITEDTPGIVSPMFFRGRYFQGVPVTITAVPREGYEFRGWQGSKQGLDASVTTVLSGPLNLSAEFERAH